MSQDELTEQKHQALESQLKYWKQSREIIERTFDTLPDEKRLAALQAYEMVTRRELDTIDELIKIERVKNAPPIPRSTSMRTSN